MKKLTTGCIMLIMTMAAAAIGQAVPVGAVIPSWLPPEASEQPAATILTNVVDTKLDMRFDYRQQRLLGTALLTLRPHFYPQAQLVLDAKGFDLQKVELVSGQASRALQYTYNQRQLTIILDRPYSRTETYQVRIAYVAKPNELPLGGSTAITADKGLYFINPLGTEAGKPRQIWTQGETQSSSCWFPTIDQPNQRMTQEIALTVENQFKTLSNGLLIATKANADGTRTDTWQLSQPHAPYLATLVVGDFAVVHDTWRGKAVDYYVEPAYAGTARAIFGHTPEMLEFYSGKLGVDYPWEKYAQVAVRDYVSGAMENTTATTHGSTIQATRRELVDANYETGESTIAHELFHQWFGDYITCESWSNLPLNESFADYAELLWAEYKYGPDEAARIQQAKLAAYLEEAVTKREPLIRYRYTNRDDMFDRHSYNKGGRVLHMLRHYVGDDAFFAALRHYLTQYKGSAVEIAQLRLVFEEMTGEDLRWFFDQWFLQRGHPELKVSHSYANGQVRLRVQQMQDTLFQPVFRLPVMVTVWVNEQPTAHRLTITQADQTFALPASQQPAWVKFDSAGQLLAQIDETQTSAELIYQFSHAAGYLQKAEALEALQNRTREAEIGGIYRQALTDRYWAIRRLSLEHLRRYRGPDETAVRRQVQHLATTDPEPRVRAQALTTLASFTGESTGQALLVALSDSSYAVNAAALTALAKLPAVRADAQAAALQNTGSSTVLLALAGYYAQRGTPNQYQWLLRHLPDVAGTDQYLYFEYFAQYLTRASAAERQAGAQVLEQYARTGTPYYVRLGAYRGLLLLATQNPALKSVLQNIRERETDSRVQGYYKLL